MALSGKRAMVVDDEPDILAVLRMALEKWQVSVDAFSEPPVAYETFARQPCEYDIVITDIRMPKMSGIELAEKIRTVRPDQPILFISAYEYGSGSVAASTGYHASTKDLLKKPVTMPAFCNAVQKKLSGLPICT